MYANNRLKVAVSVFLSIVVFTWGVIFTFAAEEVQKTSQTLEKGIGQYKHENYDEALVLLKKAKAEDPESTLASYYLGLTYKQLQNYKEAVPNLKDAVTFSPKIQGAFLELVDCLYQLGRLEEAKVWISESEKEGIRPAQVAFMKGLVLAKDGKTEDAVGSFRNAKKLDPTMTQACDYQIAFAYLKAKKMADARKAFTEVTLSDPRSNMSNFANEYVDAIARQEEATKPFKVSAGIFWQYDDNVILQPDDTSAAANISDKGDSREVTTASAEYNQMFGDKFGMRGLYTFYYAKQNDLGFYDMVTNSFIGQPTIYFENGLLTFPSGYIHTIVNDKAYLGTATTSGIYNFMVGKSNMGQAFLRYQYKDYFWSPSTPDENRSGDEFAGGVAWYYFYAENRGFVNARYEMNKETTDGNNWDYLGNRVTASVLVPVMEKLNLTISGDIFLQGFSNTNTVYNVQRRDQVYTLSALAAYKFFKDSEIQLQYTYIKDDANISVYKYNRNIYSVGVNFRF